MPRRTVVIDPMTRIEGHLRFETSIEDGRVVDARTSGEMFRGIEKALIGHDARVAQQVTQRVCGVCPYAQAEAAALALEDAMGLEPNPNGRLLRNLTVGAYQIHDYLFHFYHLSALDFIDIAAVLDYRGDDAVLLRLRDWTHHETRSGRIFPAAPFFPRLAGRYLEDRERNLSAVRNYVDAFPILARLHKMVALFGGKAPHPVAIEAGGVTTRPTIHALARYRSLLGEVRAFIAERYREDVLAVCRTFSSYFTEGRGYGNLLSYPYFPDATGASHLFAGGATIAGRHTPLDLAAITEDHTYSFYGNEPSAGVKPLQSTVLEPIDWESFERERRKADGKYSWTKAPRYHGEVMEVGPAARVVNTYNNGDNPRLNGMVDRLNAEFGIALADYASVAGRHLARYIAVSLIVERLAEQVELVEPEVLGFVEHEVPRNARGIGLTEATRGALAHWIETDAKGMIANYELVVPTTWNMGPRDARGRPGAVERMLIGTRIADPDNPLELARIVRSTDPCMACSVH